MWENLSLMRISCGSFPNLGETYVFSFPQADPESPSPPLLTSTSNGCLMSAGQVTTQADILAAEDALLSRTSSSRILSRSRHSSFRTNSLEPLTPTSGPFTTATGRPFRSFKRNRPSFIHVTAEAMQRQKSMR